jgi:ketosteroid isomerase-like protein
VASTVTYAASGRDRKATGQAGVSSLLSDLLNRKMAYSFEFHDVIFSEHDDLVWVFAEGEGHETADDGITAAFRYQTTGVLKQEGAQWRWLVLVGSEPEPYDDEPFGDVLPARPPGLAALTTGEM